RLGSLQGASLAELQLGRRSGALVLAIRRAEDTSGEAMVYRGATRAPDAPPLIANPGGDVRLEPGQLLVVMGRKGQLQAFADLLGPALAAVEVMQA
ncbi:MAG: cation:proton antiporter regulatory subunit, partial [Cyanobium sp.]